MSIVNFAYTHFHTFFTARVLTKLLYVLISLKRCGNFALHNYVAIRRQISDFCFGCPPRSDVQCNVSNPIRAMHERDSSHTRANKKEHRKGARKIAICSNFVKTLREFCTA